MLGDLLLELIPRWLRRVSPLLFVVLMLWLSQDPYGLTTRGTRWLLKHEMAKQQPVIDEQVRHLQELGRHVVPRPSPSP